MEREFKVGDHICVAEWSLEYCGDYNGKVGVIKRDAIKGKYGVELAGYWNHNSSGGYFWFNAKNLIPLKNDRKIIEDFQDTLTKMFLYSEHSNIMLSNKNVEITKVIFNNPATIVFWSDGKKTVVKCGSDEAFDEEKGLAMAISKRVLGNNGNYYNEFKKWLPEIEVCEDKGVTMVEACIKVNDAFERLTETMKGDK